jgi:uncharacterized protein (DUF1330 family)
MDRRTVLKTLIPGRLEAFLEDAGDGPIMMLNLLRFRADGGRERYWEYLARAAPLLERHGAKVEFAGDTMPALAAEDGQAWDAVALVRYPDRHAFSALFGDTNYAQVSPLRESAIEEAVLQPIAATTL